MDTFIVTSNENQQNTNTNTNTNTSLHPLSDDYNDPIRRRKKAKGGEQKVRRRGMGVEKLERLRIQEKLKQQMSTEIINNNPFAPTFQFPMSGQNPGHFGQTGQNHNMGFHGVDQFHTNVFGVIKNAAALNCTTLSQNCNTCHKKKRVLGENNPGCGKVRKEVYNMQMSPFGHLSINNGENHFLATKPAFLPQGHVEVVAVHRKGSSSERRSGVVMEYEFFPDGRSKNEKEGSLNNEHDDLVMMKNLTTTTTTNTTSADTGFDASTSIDLSLKLSL